MANDGIYDDYYNKLMREQFGRQKGSLWRSERDYFVFADKNPKGKLAECADYVQRRNEGAYDDKGFTRSRKGRYMGSIPMEVAIANPELLYDPDAAKRFFKEHPKFSSKR